MADYSMNLISLAKIPEEVRSRLTSDFRLIAEYAANKNKPEKLRNLVQNQGHTIRHPEEFWDVMGKMTNEKRFQEMKAWLGEGKQEEEDENMFTIWDEIEREGRNKFLVERVCTKLQKGKSPEAIAEDLEEELEFVQGICKVAEAWAPEYDVKEIYEAWRPKWTLS